MLQSLIYGVVGLFLVAFVAFQAYRYISSRYETETVYHYVVSETARVSGIVLREEGVLDTRIESGIADYVVADGTKVSKDMVIAEVYQNEEDAAIIRKIRSLNAQQKLLAKVQNPSISSFSHTEALNKQIFSEIGGIAGLVHSGDLGALESRSENLLIYMNSRQIATGKREDFQSVIAQLKDQEDYYLSRIESTPRQIVAPHPGYFIRTVDGFENCYDLRSLSKLRPDTLSEILMRPVKKDPTRVGKLMTNHNWYFAALVSIEEETSFRQGRNVTLDFHVAGLEPVSATIVYVNEDKDLEQAAVIFRSDYINEDIVNLRNAQVDVNFKSISGLRVSDAALRFEGLQQGVYVVQGEAMVFRPVEVVYEGTGFVLIDAVAPADQRYDQSLKLFDQVIVGGRSLYGGKQVKG